MRTNGKSVRKIAEGTTKTDSETDNIANGNAAVMLHKR